MLISSNPLTIHSTPKLDANHQLLTIQTAIINQLAQVMRGKLVFNKLLPSLSEQLRDTLLLSGALIFRADQLEPLAATEQQTSFWSICQDFCKYYRDRLAQGKLILLSVTEQRLPSSLRDSAKQANLSNLLIVPFLHRQNYIGGIALYLCEQEREWLPQEIAFVQAIADQCAIALAFTLLEERCQSEVQRRQKSETQLKALCNQTGQLIGLLTPQASLWRQIRQPWLLWDYKSQSFWGVRFGRCRGGIPQQLINNYKKPFPSDYFGLLLPLLKVN